MNDREDSPLSASNCSVTTLDVSKISLGSCAETESAMMRFKSSSRRLDPVGEAERSSQASVLGVFPFAPSSDGEALFDILLDSS